MISQENRTEQLEGMGPATTRRFVGWRRNPWTPEQLSEAARRKAHCGLARSRSVKGPIRDTVALRAAAGGARCGRCD